MRLIVLLFLSASLFAQDMYVRSQPGNKDRQGTPIPLGPDIIVNPKGAADLQLRPEIMATFLRTPVKPGQMRINIDASKFYKSAALAIDRFTPQSETLSPACPASEPGSWCWLDDQHVQANFRLAHALGGSIDQWGSVDIRNWVWRWIGPDDHELVRWVALCDGGIRTPKCHGFVMMLPDGTEVLKVESGRVTYSGAKSAR